ncbi:uncharacterized protein PV07_01663 [Cladophialophora immunda]|uniref:Uncharacterized protein n=1 Tax=Cladophialophora immunda TaxID=569365 RepID=A0A0D2BBH9_9EURO|nr:uncharacterized protein PV07_01663 [Cladophialophora immunda]KIW34922.1 hypothetical protein PV07_01663 [Cladophialophora immunda]
MDSLLRRSGIKINYLAWLTITIYVNVDCEYEEPNLISNLTEAVPRRMQPQHALGPNSGARSSSARGRGVEAVNEDGHEDAAVRKRPENLR